MTAHNFPLAEAITLATSEDVQAIVAGEPNALLYAVTPVTAELLRWWFQIDHAELRPELNFHEGQRDAIIAIIYAHEVLASESLLDLYEKVARESVLIDGRLGEVTAARNGHPKYAAKMATGTGKTWVLNALLVWQYLNALADRSDPRFTSNFLIVAPGLIVYDRLLDSFLGRQAEDGTREFETGDLTRNAELFIPDTHRESVLGFVRNSVVTKGEIGQKVTGGGAIVLTNWHVLAGQDPDAPDFLDEDADTAPGLDVDVRAAAASFIPLTPGSSAGNSLDVLDRRHRRGEAMQWLADLPSLMVFNDEAHHVHSGGKADPDSEVEWQRSMNLLADGKGRRFAQVDFSATPYNESRGMKRWFPHIVVDFPLDHAIQQGLVKALVLDKRQEIAALKNSDLDFGAVRGSDGKAADLSEGQRVMLSAGLAKLRILEEKFREQDSLRHPKLLVVVEDTSVSPLVEDYLVASGYARDDILRVDSGNKKDLGKAAWEPLRAKLFDLDNRPEPKIVISVLMLREGFDVNNICVIVPLRAAGSGILAEQTVGRGLRLMWRGEPAIEDARRENLRRFREKKAPSSYYDVLFVVEHPRFEELYDDLLGDGLMGVEETDTATPTGDVERVDLRADFAQYDFRIPFVIRDAEEELAGPRVPIMELPVCPIPLGDMLKVTKRGDAFISEEMASGTRFGAFTVEGAKLTASGYNDYLSKMANRVSGAIGRSFTGGGSLKQNARFENAASAVLQVHGPEVIGWADAYIRTRFFGGLFDPLDNEQWRVLMIDDIADRIAGNLATALVGSLNSEVTGEAEVRYRRMSEVESLFVRTSSALELTKCIYPKVRIASRSGGLERAFAEWADADSDVEALVKIDEYKHAFLRRPYLKADGMPAQYSPDFLVRTTYDVYVVETKAQSALGDANVRRKEDSARGWCRQINELQEGLRDGREWHYVLLGEKTVREWRDKGASATQLLDFAKLRPVVTSTHSSLPGL